MTLLETSVSKIFFIYVALYIVTVKGLKEQHLTYHFGDLRVCNQNSYGRYLSPGQIYGCCEDKILYKLKEQSTANCTFIMETTKVTSSPDHLRICNFNLEINPSRKYPNFKMDDGFDKRVSAYIKPLDQDKAFLQLLGYDIDTYLYLELFFVLNFNDCNASEVNVPLKPNLGISLSSVVDDKFDLYFEDFKIQKYIRTTLDTNGNIVKTAEPWIPIGNTAIMGALSSPGNGHIVVLNQYLSVEKNTVKIIMARNDGSFELLKEKPMDDDTYPRSRYPLERMITSFKYNLASVCTKLHKILTCSQFDNKGNEKFEIKIALHNYPIMLFVSLHNLPGGGFLLISSECGGVYDRSCHGHSFFHIRRFDASGRFVESAKGDNDPSTSEYEQIHVFENEEEELCLSYLNDDELEYGKMTHLNVYCFEYEDFYPEIM